MATPAGNVAALTGNPSIDGLVQGSVWQFAGSQRVITYSLSQNDTGVGGTWGSSPLASAVRQALDAWSSVANITFVESGSGTVFTSSTADIAFTLTGDELASGGGVGIGIFPDPVVAAEVRNSAGYSSQEYPRPEGDVFFDNFYPGYGSGFRGDKGFALVMHEIGHALGLKHPNDDGGNGRPTFASLGIGSYDSVDYTLMSTDVVNGPNASAHPFTPMLLDIAAIQYIYGANTTFNSGDSNYFLTGRHTIWDTGGIDSLDLGGSGPEHIDLHAGAVSFNTDTRITIAYGVLVENAFGGFGDDVIIGNDANNFLTGGDGIDRMEGGRGNDTYEVRQTADVVIELPGEGVDTVQSGVTGFTLGPNIEILRLLGGFDGTGNDLDNQLYGNPDGNVLSGQGGNDLLDGGGGDDTMVGGAGDDAYIVDRVGDVVSELAGGGFDSVTSAVTYTLSADVENLVLTGVTRINGTGNAQANRITGNSNDNVLDGQGGSDTLVGGAGNDHYYVDSSTDVVIERENEGQEFVLSSASYTLSAHVENLVLTGLGAINATGNDLVNTLNGNASGNQLDGGLGADTMFGQAGDDTYFVDVPADNAFESANEGYDRVVSAATYSLVWESHVEELRLTGSAAVDGIGNPFDNVLIGNDAANTLTGNAGNDTLIGNGGVDTMQGGTGDDTYHVERPADAALELANEGYDRVLSAATYALWWDSRVEELTLTGSAAVDGAGNPFDNMLIGNDAANVLVGNAGNDTLIGNGGVDTMHGGTGDDTYTVERPADAALELANEGYDRVLSAATYALWWDSHVEELTLTGSAAVDGTGNQFDNVLIGNDAANVLVGNAGNDTLTGNGGADFLYGGAGDDTYHVEAPSDGAIESADEGYDRVLSAATYSLWWTSHVEELTLTGSAAIDGIGNLFANVLIGNSVGNQLFGHDGDDTLIGGGGMDSLYGGTGNDTYDVDSSGDVIHENANEGTDTVNAAATYVLGANVERLTLKDGIAWDATGNALNNVLTGNGLGNQLFGGDGEDTLIGGGGMDSLYGGTGNDTYDVDSSGDVIHENVNEGIDTVNAAATYALGANVERVTLKDGIAWDATGNELSNVLTGNGVGNQLFGGAGDDLLIGGGGMDSMYGGAGNDTFDVDNSGDVIHENASEGVDTVNAAATYVLGANIETLTLKDGIAWDATGNDLNNDITGNGVGNQLFGGAGHDTLTGGGGMDSLFGGAGADRFDYNALSEGGDVIADFTKGSGGDALDVRDVLVGYQPGNVAAFVQLAESGGSTMVSVNADGSGSDFVLLATLQGVTGLVLNDMVAQGNLLVA